VILIDANMSSFAQHNLARDWLDQQLNASRLVGLPWRSVLAFLRLVTNPRGFEHPEPIRDAWQQVRTWLKSETTLDTATHRAAR
jgi:predicted nucleic acid-binding protein